MDLLYAFSDVLALGPWYCVKITEEPFWPVMRDPFDHCLDGERGAEVPHCCLSHDLIVPVRLLVFWLPVSHYQLLADSRLDPLANVLHE